MLLTCHYRHHCTPTTQSGMDDREAKSSLTLLTTDLLVSGAGSAIYGSAGGGCMLASLSNFSSRQDTFALLNLDPQPVTIMRFYQLMLREGCYWYAPLSRQHNPQNKGVNSESSKQPDLKMAGRSFGVSCQQVSPKERGRNGARRYQSRMTRHGFHNANKIEDTVFKT